MALRRPLVVSGGFVSEADNTDSRPITGTILYGSGLNNQQFALESDSTVFVNLAPQASGLLFENGNPIRLTDDGVALLDAQAALVAANDALATVNPALLSGLAAQQLAFSALASGNAAIEVGLDAIASGNAAQQLADTAQASGNAAEARLIPLGGLINSAYFQNQIAYATGVAANQDSVEALASGNAALFEVINNPFITENQLIGLIFALS